MLSQDELKKVEDLIQHRTRYFVDDFRSFVFKQNIMSLAIGVVIGTATTSMVTAFIADLFMPVVNLLLKDQAWRQWGPTISYIVVDPAKPPIANKLLLGDLIWNSVNLIVIGLLAYIGSRVILKTLTPPSAPTQQCPYCLEKIAVGATRCKFCTSELPNAQASPVKEASA